VNTRLRVFFLVALAAATAAAVTTAVAWLTTDRPSAPRATPSGPPPLALDLRERVGPEAAALRRAQSLYRSGRRDDAARIFARYGSAEARVGAALAAWPRATVDRLAALARARPRSGVVLLNLGIALLWDGRRGAAERAWRAASERDPDSYYAVRADDFLHPDFAPGLPAFLPSVASPLAVRRLPPHAELRALARAARRGDPEAKLLYGAALQTLDRPLSAEHEFAAAATLAPHSVEAQVAAAVARFRKSDPSLAFSRLGPLARRFPRASTVRFHLGLLLLWIGELRQARRELTLAVSDSPASRPGREAKRLLASLRSIRTE
jgi:tetratricopeptide (TPR) repeat protein